MGHRKHATQVDENPGCLLEPLGIECPVPHSKGLSREFHFEVFLATAVPFGAVDQALVVQGPAEQMQTAGTSPQGAGDFGKPQEFHDAAAIPGHAGFHSAKLTAENPCRRTADVACRLA